MKKLHTVEIPVTPQELIERGPPDDLMPFVALAVETLTNAHGNATFLNAVSIHRPPGMMVVVRCTVEIADSR